MQWFVDGSGERQYFGWNDHQRQRHYGDLHSKRNHCAGQPQHHSASFGGTLSSAVTVAVTDLVAVSTHHNDNARTGQNTKEYALSPATVSCHFIRQAFLLHR